MHASPIYPEAKLGDKCIQELCPASTPLVVRAIEVCLAHKAQLNDWERNFVESLAGYPPHRMISTKQFLILAKVFKKLELEV